MLPTSLQRLPRAGAPKVSRSSLSEPMFTILPTGPLVNVEAIAHEVQILQ
ncbi:MAG: hypothetical protein CM15mV3_0970 [Caudoviricetes sp.]|nr:MAG: hypothetical protein CM15mV3_0970 [Caudoviricetes sp.]